MSSKSAVIVSVLAGLFVTLPAPVESASLAAGSEICNGFFGSVEQPRLACALGVPGGQATIINGGSGVGSGIDIPFQSNGFGTEFSAAAAALQDYGVFHGYGTIHKVDPNPNVFGGVYRARAWGEFRDTWTITNGTGPGQLNLEFSISGGASLTIGVAGGTGGEGGQSDLSMLLYMAAANEPSQLATLCCVSTAGTYLLTPGVGSGLTFTFGVPFDVQVVTVVMAGGGYDPLNPPSFFELDATASFEHTASLTGIYVTDQYGNPILDFGLTAASGAHYPLTAAQVPLPPAWGLLLAGLPLIRRAACPRRPV